MNCKLCQKEIDSYHNGSLSRDMKTQVDSHINSCRECRTVFTSELITGRVIELEKGQEPDPFLATRVMSLIETQEKVIYVPGLTLRIMKPALVTLTLAAAIFLGVIIGSVPYSIDDHSRLPLELLLIDDASIESITSLTKE